MISFSALLKNSWNIYKKHFLLFIGIALPVMAVNVIVSIFGIIPSSLSSVFIVVGNIAGFLLSLLVGVSLIYAMKEREEGITVKQALKKGWKHLFSYLWLNVLLGFIIMGGFFLLVIPGIIFSIWFSMVTYVFVVEGKGGMTALLRSKHLVNGHWWGVLLRLLAFNTLLFLPVLLLVLGAGFGIGLSFEQILMKEGNTAVIDVPLSIIMWLIMGFGVAFGYLLYENLRDLKRDVIFEEPKKSTKVKFLLVGVFGVIAPFLLILSTVVVILVNALIGDNN